MSAEGKVKKYTKQLEHKREAKKLAAVCALAATKSPLAFEPLLQAMGGYGTPVKKAAISALGSLKDPRALTPLVNELTNWDHTVRAVAAEALGTLSDAGAVEPLILALGDEEGDVRKAAATSLSLLGEERYRDTVRGDVDDFSRLAALHDGRLFNPFKKALKGKTADVREAAAKALGELRDPRSAEPLLGALKDHDANVSSAAAQALIVLKDPKTVEPLIKLLCDNPGSVRMKAAGILAKLGEPTWETMIMGNFTDFTRLVKTKDTRIIKYLSLALEDGSFGAKECADLMLLLGACGESQAVEPIIRLLVKNSTESDIERKAQLDAYDLERQITEMRRLQSRAADADMVEVIIKGIQEKKDRVWDARNKRRDERHAICLAAIEALGALGDTRAVEPAIKILEKNEYMLCNAAAMLLGKLNDVRAVEPLIKALERSARLEAQAALDALNNPHTVEALIKMLGNMDNKVRMAAVKTLAKFGETKWEGIILGRDYNQDLVNLINSEDPRIDKQILDANRYIKMLNEPETSKENLVTAVRALGALREPKAVGPLMERLGTRGAEFTWEVARALLSILKAHPEIDVLDDRARNLIQKNHSDSHTDIPLQCTGGGSRHTDWDYGINVDKFLGKD